MSAAGTRARVRAELTREIADVARRHLATDGAAALSLRAVAREMGMASSAVYRYFPSRDDLLTTLIVDAYTALGDAVERAEAAVPRADLRGRWRTAGGAARTWAVAHPHEYALLYGSPVPGYAAPEVTIGPASRVGEVLCRIVADGIASGAVTDPGDDGGPLDDAVLEPAIPAMLGVPPGTAATRLIIAWTGLFGMISFELFGHTTNVVTDHAGFFAAGLERLADDVGVPRTR